VSTVRVTIDQVAGAISIHDKSLRAACKKAGSAAAHRLKAHLRGVIKASGINDLGTYMAGIQVVGTSVVANAPHSGIVESGARPHKVSLQGIIAIAEWVVRKLRLRTRRRASDRWRSKSPEREFRTRKYGWAEALGIARAIAKKIEREGQQGRYFMRDALPKARQFYHEELNRITQGVAARSAISASTGGRK
jgi:hypothetical protein